MAPPLLGAEIFSQGFRFQPTPEEAATYYLPRLVAGEPLHDAVRPVVHHADVYACAPGDLARQFRPLPRTGDRFFFTPGAASRKRARGCAGGRDGSWHAQNTTDIVLKPRAGDGRDAKTKVGELRKLRYKKSGGAYTDWLMDEYSSCSCYYSVAAGGGESRQFVLCKMYVSPRADPTSEAHRESVAYFFTLPPPPTAAVMQMQMQMQPAPPAAAPKRLAAPPTPPPCAAKRMRRGPGHGDVSFSMPTPPPQPSCAPLLGVPTRSSIAAVAKMPLAPPHPTRPAMRPHRSPTPLPAPQQPPLPQQVPLPTPPTTVVRMPLQVPVQSKQRRILDPFEAAAMLRDEAGDQTVAAPPHPPPELPPPAAMPALQDQDEDDWDELDKALEFENLRDQEDEDDWDDLDKALEFED